MKFPDTLPDDDERIIHCREEGCIGKYAPPRIERFAEAGILHPEAREIGVMSDTFATSHNL